jgi:hypothetical protein
MYICSSKYKYSYVLWFQIIFLKLSIIDIINCIQSVEYHSATHRTYSSHRSPKFHYLIHSILTPDIKMNYIFQVIVLKFVKCLTNLIIIALKTIYTASNLFDQFGFTSTWLKNILNLLQELQTCANPPHNLRCEGKISITKHPEVNRQLHSRPYSK